MELNEQIKKALETKDVETVVTALYDSRCGDTYGDNIFEIIIYGYYCGCGSYSDEDTELIKKVFYYAAENRTEKFKDVIFNEYFGDEDRMAEMMMNILDSVGLVEHGSTMRYPWLTDIGEALYAGLKDLERIEAEYKKENDWYDGVCGFDFGLIDNPYEEKKERTHYVPEVVKNMFEKVEEKSILYEIIDLTPPKDLKNMDLAGASERVDEWQKNHNLKKFESGNGTFIIGDFTPDMLKFEDNRLFGEGISLKRDEKPSDGLNRAQRRKRNKEKKD